MADKKITDLPLTAGAAFTDLVEKVNGGITSESMTLTQIFALFKQVHQGVGAPIAPPAVPTIEHVYTNLTTGDVYTWNVGTAAWI